MASPALATSHPRRPAATLDDLGVAAVGEDALAEPEVRPGAVPDRRLARQDQFDLGVVEPHAVADEQMAIEHAEVVEMLDRAATRPLEVALGIGRRGRQVHRHSGV